jgi:hypothetical protein
MEIHSVQWLKKISFHFPISIFRSPASLFLFRSLSDGAAERIDIVLAVG